LLEFGQILVDQLIGICEIFIDRSAPSLKVWSEGHATTRKFVDKRLKRLCSIFEQDHILFFHLEATVFFESLYFCIQEFRCWLLQVTVSDHTEDLLGREVLEEGLDSFESHDLRHRGPIIGEFNDN
jgi:hypothetical protein